MKRKRGRSRAVAAAAAGENRNPMGTAVQTAARRQYQQKPLLIFIIVLLESPTPSFFAALKNASLEGRCIVFLLNIRRNQTSLFLYFDKPERPLKPKIKKYFERKTAFAFHLDFLKTMFVFDENK
ncbi:hypothetical protein MmiHf6_01900 [Methanimicrococcus hongohii]|uniref:Uncharacterized protein n=1 Tax=Methanimicrococcus hongohii TaxID=3028295 RepID=A0AA97A137_9EURY|nr:hypothetical protein [Methanimicrococcus sp. Hf6]WNY22898.1 hypothetical protein MmiHf6_01900 [Methanimicrococcus sp. Hf6]